MKTMIIDTNDIARIKKKIDRSENEREIIIKKSREILRSSKQAIYLVHRNELKDASDILNRLEKQIRELRKTTGKGPSLTGALGIATQEFVEAKCYHEFVTKKRIPSASGMGVELNDYLLGLCDLTGELGRRAVASVIKKDFKEVYVIRDAVDEIYSLFLHLDLRNSELRKKSDAIKWNLKKIEDIVYDIKTRGMEK